MIIEYLDVSTGILATLDAADLPKPDLRHPVKRRRPIHRLTTVAVARSDLIQDRQNDLLDTMKVLPDHDGITWNLAPTS